MLPTHKTCTICGQVRALDEFYVNKEGRHGRQATCKDCTRERQKRYILRPKAVPDEKRCSACGEVKPAAEFNRRNHVPTGLHPRCRECQTKYRWSPKSKFRVYKNEAARRGIPFDLELSDFTAFWQVPCSYCGDPIDTIGLDRVDNTHGYTVGNITSCCSTCNYSKRDLPSAQWVAHITKVLAHLQKPSSGD